ncbi:MAG: NYN domain-containing protein [Endomicrobiia bacterium]
MVHYILDGYNIVKQLPQFIGRKLKEGREYLIKVLKENRPQGSARNKVTVVFDGAPDVSYPSENLKNYNIEIIFTTNEIADEKIRKLVKKSPNPGNVVVVSDDKDLRRSVRILGAEVLYVREFMKYKKKKDDKVLTQTKTKLSPEEQFKITEELKKIWKDD